MPWAAIAAIASLASAAFTVGDTIYQQENAPNPNAVDNTAKQAQLAQNDAASAAAKKAQAATIANQLPNLQEQTGGATSPEYLASVAGTQTGAPGEPNVFTKALADWLGLGGGGAATPTPAATTGKSDFFPSAAVPAFADFLPSSGGGNNNQLQGGSA